MSTPAAVAGDINSSWGPDHLLSVPEFCAWARVPRRTFGQWCQDGNAPKRIKFGNHVRIRWFDALVWAEARYVD